MITGGVESVHTVKFHKILLSFSPESTNIFSPHLLPPLHTRSDANGQTPEADFCSRVGTVKCRNTQGSSASTARSWRLPGSMWALLLCSAGFSMSDLTSSSGATVLGDSWRSFWGVRLTCLHMLLLEDNKGPWKGFGSLDARKSQW